MAAQFRIPADVVDHPGSVVHLLYHVSFDIRINPGSLCSVLVTILPEGGDSEYLSDLQHLCCACRFPHLAWVSQFPHKSANIHHL